MHSFLGILRLVQPVGLGGRRTGLLLKIKASKEGKETTLLYFCPKFLAGSRLIFAFTPCGMARLRDGSSPGDTRALLARRREP
jgi:hypothetical protein